MFGPPEVFFPEAGKMGADNIPNNHRARFRRPIRFPVSPAVVHQGLIPRPKKSNFEWLMLNSELWKAPVWLHVREALEPGVSGGTVDGKAPPTFGEYPLWRVNPAQASR